MSYLTDRRRFLKSTALTGVGVFVAGTAAAEDSKSPNERIRFGCIGVGGKGQSDSGDAKNHGEAQAHDAEKAIAEYGDKAAQSDKSAIEAAVAALRTALQGEDLEAIKARTADLTQAQMKLGEAMYKAQQANAAGQGAEAEAGAPKDDVIDAEFREVDDDKKKS